MNHYELNICGELILWQKKMLRNPTILNKLSSDLQKRYNKWIPEKIHLAITATMKQMIRAVLFGAGYVSIKPSTENSLEVRETAVKQRIEIYRKTAAVEGGLTGAGGFFLGLVDFPVLIVIKIKLLFDIAALYGFNLEDYKERLFLLHIFELAFSSHMHRRKVYLEMTNWDEKSKLLPEDNSQFNWRSFQQEYRDYIDLAKMAQLIPVIGAPVGIVVNYRLLKKLGITAMNAYRMRILDKN